MTCYLPLYEPNPRGGLERYTKIWRNFIEGDCRTTGYPARHRIEHWNGIVIDDAVKFKTEADKAWFILRWS